MTRDKAMKHKLMSLAMGAMAVAGLNAAQPSDYTIYINPGHGGHNAANDRNVVIEPYAAGDPEGFWESNSNLDKGLMLRDMLEAKGYNVVMSRVTNTEDDDLPLSTIVALANKSEADLFMSIHSNATGTANRVNFPMTLFRGLDNSPERPESKEWATVVDSHLLDNGVTWWTSSNANVRGDWSFYPSWGTQGLGVLRGLTVTGMLSEGSFHDYIPETYRLMNMDFKWFEAWHFMKAIEDYLGLPGDDNGGIIGRLNDNRLLRAGDYKMFGDDRYAVVPNATVSLYDASGETLIATSTTDNLNNGVYAFREVAPGNYKIKVTSATHEPAECDVVVEADKITCNNIQLRKVRDTPPEVISFEPVWNVGDEGVLCNSPVILTFNWDMDTESVENGFVIEPSIDGTFAWSELNTVLTFTPSVPYQTSTLYTVTLPQSVCHAGGTPMTQPFEMKFTTNDRDYMKVLNQFPSQGDKVHYKGVSVEVRLDKVPNISSANAALSIVDSQGTKMQTNRRLATYSKKGDPYGFFRIPLYKDLTIGETYTFTISADMVDTDGISLKEGTEVTFEAVDAGEEKTTPVINEDDKASAYELSEDGTFNMSTATVADSSTDKLFGESSVLFTYAFESNDAEAEILWARSESAETPIEMSASDAVGVHIYGDLTENEVYLQMTSAEYVKYVSVGEMDFLGWRYVEVPLTSLEGDSKYHFTGIKIGQTPSQMSQKGSFCIDNIHFLQNGVGGVDNIGSDQLGGLTIYPNPASEYLIANADGLIQSVELLSLNGSTVAKGSGNILNVSDIPAGVYLARVNLSHASVIRKIVIAH